MFFQHNGLPAFRMNDRYQTICRAKIDTNDHLLLLQAACCDIDCYFAHEYKFKSQK